MGTIRLEDQFLNKVLYKPNRDISSNITDIGFFPHAKYHYINRKNGRDEYILLLCVFGKGYVEINNKKFVLEANKFIIINKGDAHTYYSDNECPWSIYWCHFIKLNKYDCINEVHDVPVLGYSSIIQVFNNIFNYEYNDAKSIDYLNTCWDYIISSLLYKVNELDKVDERLSPLIDYMKENIASNLSLGDLTYFSKLSSSQLSLLFKNKYQQSPIAYYNELRIKYTITLLLNTNMTISEIAKSIGIDDQFYFSRLFKKITGVSPLKYRVSNIT